MKKLVIACISLAIFAGNGLAQGNSPQLSSADLKQRMALDAPQLYKRYKSGSTLSGVGAGLTIGGAVAIVVGIAIADKETKKTNMGTQTNLSGPGAAVFAVGLVSALAGTPLWIIGHSKKKRAKNAHLRDYGYSGHIPAQSSPYLQIKAAPNGMGAGLALIF
jgi:ABC-type uncharacterized transport system permease subunit